MEYAELRIQYNSQGIELEAIWQSPTEVLTDSTALAGLIKASADGWILRSDVIFDIGMGYRKIEIIRFQRDGLEQPEDDPENHLWLPVELPLTLTLGPLDLTDDES